MTDPAQLPTEDAGSTFRAQDSAITHPFFSSTTSDASPPLPPLKLCPSPLCNFSETATERLHVETIPSEISARERERLAVALVMFGFFVLAVFMISTPAFLRLILVSGGTLAAYLSVRQVLPKALAWMRMTGRVRGTFIHSFNYKSCPRCGRTLIEHCKHCRGPIIGKRDDFCWFCGVKYWWAVLREELGKEPVVDWRSTAHRFVDFGDDRTVWTLAVSVSRVAVDGVVSTDTIEGRMAGQVGVHLYAIGGEEIELASIGKVTEKVAADEDLSTVGDVWTTPASAKPALGDVWSTAAGTLPASVVLHTAMVAPEIRSTDVRNAVRNCLRAAEQLGLRSLAMPLLGTGRGEVTAVAAIREFAEAFSEWRAEARGPLEDVIMIFREEAEAFVFRNTAVIGGGPSQPQDGDPRTAAL